MQGNLAQQLANSAYQHFQNPSSSALAQNTPERTSINHSQPQIGMHRVIVSEVPSNFISSQTTHHAIDPQRIVNVAGQAGQQITVYGHQNIPAAQVAHSNIGDRTQLAQQYSSNSGREWKLLEEENLKLKSIIQRMRIDRDDLVKSHDTYMKNDEAARVQIFGQVRKLQNTVLQKSKQLQESRQRQMMVSRQLEELRNQSPSQFNEAQRNANTINLMEKLKIALESKQVEVQSLKQAIQHLDINLSNSQKIRSEQASKLKSLQASMLLLQAQNSSLKEYQSQQYHQMNYRLREIDSLKAHVAELQRRSQDYEREKEVLSTHVDEKQTERDVKLKSALQDAEASNLTLQYLSNEIHNYRLIIQDLETHKESGYKKDVQLTKLHHTLTEKEKQIIYLQNDNQALKLKLSASQHQHKLSQEQHKSKIRELEQECMSLNRRSELIQTEKARFAQMSSLKNDTQIVQLAAALDQSRSEFFNLRRISDEKIFELETAKIDLEIQIQSMAQAIQQKEAERLFFQNQYRALHSQFLESKKQASGFQPLHEEIKILKEELFQSKQQNNRLEIELRRIMDVDQSRTAFNAGGDFSKILESQHPRKHQEQQHHRQAQSIGGLREQNENLKHLLQNARVKLEEYSSDFDECQRRMSGFQERMQNLLAGGNSRQIINQESIYQQKQKMDEVVHELKSKLKLFKKENEQLKRKARVPKEDRRSRQPQQKRRSKDKQQASIRQYEQYIPQRRGNEQLVSQLKSSLEVRENEIKKLISSNQQLVQQMAQIQQVNAQNQATLKQYEAGLSQYEEAAAQYENRIKQYQNQMLKLKQKYKQQANAKLSEEVERPSSSAENVSERLEFFRSKSLESEQRVKQLLKINNELKVQLEQASYLVGGQSISAQKIKLLEENIASLQKRLMSATEENLHLKAQISSGHSNPNSSSILELKIRQLTEENSQLRIQISQTRSQIAVLKQAGLYSSQQPNNIESQHLEFLERKLQTFTQHIYALEQQKMQLQGENEELKARIGRQNIQDSNLLLEQISRLQQETYQLRVLNRELQTKSPGVEGGVSMDTYNMLMVEVGKLMKLIDSLHTAFTHIIEDVDRVGNQPVKMSIDGVAKKVVELFRDIELIKGSVGGMRQQFETATAIHEMQQLI